jgi:hypothetical protein
MKRLLEVDTTQQILPDEVWLDIIGRIFVGTRSILRLSTVAKWWQRLVNHSVKVLHGEMPTDPLYLAQFVNARTAHYWSPLTKVDAALLACPPFVCNFEFSHLHPKDFTIKGVAAVAQQCRQLTLIGDGCMTIEMFDLFTGLEGVTLFYSFNRTNPLPLHKLSRLNSLRIEGDFSQHFPQHLLSPLTQLRSLALIANTDEDPGYGFLSCLTNLSQLDISFAVRPSQRYHHHHPVTRLRFFDHREFDALEKMTALRTLNINNNDIFPSRLLSKLTQLTWLDVGMRNFRGDLDGARRLTNLTHLHLDGYCLEEFTHLRSLGTWPLLK